MAIYSQTLTAKGQATTGQQFRGLMVVGLHGLDNGVVSLQRSPDNSTWYDVRVYTDDGEYDYEAPGGEEVDYYRVLVLSKPRTGNLLVRLGNGALGSTLSDLVSPSGIVSGRKTIATSPNVEPLVASSTPCVKVDVQALSTNTNVVAVGDSGLDGTNGIFLNAGDTYSFTIDDVNKIHLITAVSGEGVAFNYFTQ